MLKVVAIFAGLMFFAVGLGVVHAAVLGALEGNPLMIATLAAMLIFLFIVCYLYDHGHL